MKSISNSCDPRFEIVANYTLIDFLNTETINCLKDILTSILKDVVNITNLLYYTSC